MKVRTTCLLLFLFLVIGSVVATEISGGSVSGDWYSSGNPYNINGEIYVDAVNSLTIHEGVEVVFQGYFKFIIYGSIEAIGTDIDSIRFTAADTVTGWRGLRFLNASGNSDINYCRIEHGHASGSYPSPDRNGGGIYCYNSNPEITNCTFYSNSASSDSSAYGGALYIELCQPQIIQCRFIGNSVSGTWARGGGIACVSASPTIEECNMSNNTGEYSSGGIFIGPGSGSTIVNCNISQNSAATCGGGLGIVSGTMTIINGCTIMANTAGTYGGGIACDSASIAVIEDCAIIGNTAPSYGGGIYCGDNSNPDICGNTIDGNTAAKGGGIYCNYSHPAVIENHIIQNQTNSGYGGGIYCNFSDPDIIKNTIYGNVAVFGGGIRCWVSSPSITGNTITGNWATYGGGINSGGGTPEVVNCIIWGNSMNQITEGLAITYSDIQGGWTGTGNIDLDPLFVSSAYHDYRLSWGSPCIDSGDPFSPLDPDGTVCDMGAFCYDQSIPVRILLTPHDAPITIPAIGSSFDYTIQATNIDPSSFPTRIWCDVTLPDGTIYGPVLGLVTVELGTGITISRDRTQNIPAGAPSGIYSYNAYAVAGSDTSFDSFAFTKLESDGSDWYSGWSNTGEDFGELFDVSTAEILPTEYVLHSPYPNPFNPSTTISYQLPKESYIELTIFGMTGREVASLVDRYENAGSHEVIFDARDLPSGIYFARLTVDGEQSMVQKLVLMK